MQTDCRVLHGRHITATVVLSMLLSIAALALAVRPAMATSFSVSATKDTSMTPMGLAVGDVNSDGRDDVVVPNFNSNSVSVFLQETSGTLTDAINYELYPTTKTPVTRPGIPWTTTHPAGIAIGDLSGDGRDDVVVTDPYNWALFYFEQDNPGSYTDPLDNTPDLWQPTDDYGSPELMQPPEGDPNRIFTSVSEQHRYAFAYQFHFVNLHLDQVPDRLNFVTGAGAVRLTYETPYTDSDFWTPIIYTDGGDVTGEMQVKFSVDPDAQQTSSTWEIDGYRVWYDYTTPHPFSQPYGVEIADLIDFLPGNEAIVANPEPLRNYARFIVDGGGNLECVEAPADARENIINARCYTVTTGDFNYDFTTDFAMAGWNTGLGYIALQSSTGWMFHYGETDWQVGTNPFGIASGDLNGDGRDDIAASAYGSDQISFICQNTAGYPDPVETVGTGDKPMGIAVDDVTADGKNDIIVANSNDRTIGVISQSTDGSFTAMAAYGAGWYPYYVKTGDLDGDTGKEIVVSNANDDTIQILQPSPRVTWVIPTAGGSLRGTAYPTVTAPAGTGIDYVNFYLDGLPIATASGEPYRFELDTTAIGEGMHTLTAVAGDGQGHTYTTPDRSFRADNTAPGISGMSATPNPFYPLKRDGYKDNCYFRFRLTEPATARVRIYRNGILVRTLSRNAGSGWNTVVWDGKLVNGRRYVGNYAYRVQATDAAGNSRLSGVGYVKIRKYVLVLVAPNKVILVPH